MVVFHSSVAEFDEWTRVGGWETVLFFFCHRNHLHKLCFQLQRLVGCIHRIVSNSWMAFSISSSTTVSGNNASTPAILFWLECHHPPAGYLDFLWIRRRLNGGISSHARNLRTRHSTRQAVCKTPWDIIVHRLLFFLVTTPFLGKFSSPPNARRILYWISSPLCT